jgi:hypothetical protein
MDRGMKMSRLKMSRRTKVILVAALGGIALSGALSRGSFLDSGANAASTGTSALITIQGSGAATSLGDYISSYRGAEYFLSLFHRSAPWPGRIEGRDF